MEQPGIYSKKPTAKENVVASLKYLSGYWYLLIAAIVIAGNIGYYFVNRIKPIYTATITFVLSSDQRPSSFSGFATQMGFDMGGGADNIFSGDNIIDFFKSRSLVGKALFSLTDTLKKETLLNLIARKHYSEEYAKVGIFESDPLEFSAKQTILYRSIIDFVTKNFVVLKKDKKLIFYLINATDTEPDIAYYIANNMLAQTSKYFIETKTKVRRESIKVMKREADSLYKKLSSIYVSSASQTDRTYNLNPALTVQRSGLQITQNTAAVTSSSYQQVMQNLESAKNSLQQETPLYRIIDMPELPLPGVKPSKIVHIFITSVLGVILISVLLTADNFIKNK